MKTLAAAIVAVTLATTTGAYGLECGIPKNQTRQTASASLYVVGGSDAGFLEFPWQVALQRFDPASRTWNHTCGGAIIDKDWLLTAAHCVDYRAIGDMKLRVIVGEHDYQVSHGTETIFNLTRQGDVAIHSQWNMDRIDYDYALIQLPQSLNFTGKHSHLTTICLPTAANFTSFDDMNCWASGWGITKANGDWRNVARVLQKVELRVPNHEECKRAWIRGGIAEGAVRLTPRMICGAPAQGEGHGICKGDSGGPLQCKKGGRWFLAGVASFVKYCGAEKQPNVYARTSDPEFIAWMQVVMKNRARQ